MLGDLVCDLILVLTPVVCVEEFYIGDGAVVAGQIPFVAQDFGPVEYAAFVEVVEDAFEFFGAESGVVVFF